MLRNLPLRFQIGLAFSSMVILMVLVAYSALSGLMVVSRGFVDYRALARDTNLASEVQATIFSMRLIAKEYLIYHRESDLEKYYAQLNVMNESLRIASNEIQHPERAANILKIKATRDAYLQSFERVAVLTKEEARMVSDVLDIKGEEMGVLLSQMMKVSLDDSDDTGVYYLRRVQENLSAGLLFFARYEMDHIQENFDFAHVEFVNKLNDNLSTFDRPFLDDEQQRQLNIFRSLHSSFVAEMGQLHAITIELDQLVDDIVNNLGPEIARLAVVVQHSVRDDQEVLGPEVQLYSERLLVKKVVLSVIAIVIAIVVAITLFWAIWKPLGAEPRTLLDMVNRMAKGDLSSDIAGQNAAKSGVFAGMLDMRKQLNDCIETERTAARENAQIRQALDNSSSHVLLVDSTQLVLYMNDAASALLDKMSMHVAEPERRLTASTIVGQPIQLFYEKLGSGDITNDVLTTQYSTELVWYEHIINVVMTPILNVEAPEENHFLGSVVELFDLTDTRRAEQEKAAEFERDKNDAKQLKGKVDEILNVVNAASKGDLTQLISVNGNDAIGQVGQCLSGFFHELSTNMQTIGQTAESLTRSSNSLFTINKNLGQSAAATSTQAGVVHTSSEQINANVNSVAVAVDELTASVREIAKSAADAATVATNAVELAESTDVRVKQLSISSQDIGNVVKVINSIAEQTNLLALNATIEAARAGESGKGFAVVANEVKELAKQTAEATDEISQKIGAIQSDSEIAVDSIGDINKIIGKIHGIQTTIACAVEQQDATAKEISRSVNEAALGTAEIATSIADVAKGADGARVETQNALEATTEQEQLAGSLHQLVAKFKLSERNKV